MNKNRLKIGVFTQESLKKHYLYKEIEFSEIFNMKILELSV